MLATLSPARAALAAETQDTDTESPSPNPVSPYLRVLLGDLAFLGLQAAWYWGHQSPSESEIQPYTWTTWRTKLFSDRYFVFDNDHFNTNAIGHPVAGVVYYHIARGSGLGVGASFLTTVAASTAWKYFGESNQKLSINDLVVTPMAGWVIGEATYRLGSFFADGEPSFANCLGALVFSPVATLTEAPVCHSRAREPPFDEFGGSRRTWHRLSAGLGLAQVAIDGAPARTETTFGLAARITGHRYYQRPGRGTTTARAGQWTTVGSKWLMDNGTIDGVAFHADSLIIGRYFRDYADTGGGGEPDGRGLMAGLGSSFDYDARILPTVDDRTMAVGLLGPLVELSARHGRLAVRATFAASYGFAQVTSLAWAQSSVQYTSVYVKSILQLQGYYFGQGLLTFATVEAELGDVRLTLASRTQSIWSFNHADDHQGEIQNNFSLQDNQGFFSAIAALQPFGGPVRLTFEADGILRSSTIPGTVVRSDEQRTVGAVVLLF